MIKLRKRVGESLNRLRFLFLEIVQIGQCPSFSKGAFSGVFSFFSETRKETRTSVKDRSFYS